MELIDGGVGESQQLDYKLTFALSNDDDKRSVLADATAMANTSGGIIFFGVETQRDAHGSDTGVPIGLPGLANLNFDVESLKITNTLRDAAEPSLTTQIFVKDIPLANGNKVLALGVSRSYLAPHRAAYKGLNRFYRRSQSGNYQPEVAELRRMFLEQHAWAVEAGAFADLRASGIVGGMSGLVQTAEPVLVVHLLPLGRLDSVFDMKGRKEELGKLFMPFKASGFSWEYNLEGVRAFAPNRTETVWSYCQICRNGVVEFASRSFGEPRTQENPQYIWANEVATVLRTRLPETVARMRSALKVEPPYLIIIRLLNVDNARLATGKAAFHMNVDHPIEAPAVVLPPIFVDDPAAFGVTQIDDALDVLWQSAGYSEVPRETKA